MNAHHFIDNVKVQRFCLTLLEEARLWFQSLEPSDNITGPQLQNLFRQRYSNWVIHVNNYFMHGGHSLLMRIMKP